MKIINSLKQRAFNTGIGTILLTFCCGVATFVTNPKYSQVPGTKDDVEERLPGQEVIMDNIGAALIMLRKGTDVMRVPAART